MRPEDAVGPQTAQATQTGDGTPGDTTLGSSATHGWGLQLAACIQLAEQPGHSFKAPNETNGMAYHPRHYEVNEMGQRRLDQQKRQRPMPLLNLGGQLFSRPRRHNSGAITGRAIGGSSAATSQLIDGGTRDPGALIC